MAPFSFSVVKIGDRADLQVYLNGQIIAQEPVPAAPVRTIWNRTINRVREIQDQHRRHLQPLPAIADPWKD
jgi:hypothetical protein